MKDFEELESEAVDTSEVSYGLECIFRPAEDDAAAVGCTVVYPAANQLQIDVDTVDQLIKFRYRVLEVSHLMQCNLDVQIRESKSGGNHKHITVTLEHDIDNWQRIALQFLLCSDPARESMNALRMLALVPQPIRFFEKETASND